MTRLPANPSQNPDYITYVVCTDCYYFIATEEELK